MEPRERISKDTGKSMIVTALGFDIFQGLLGIIPVVGLVLSPIIFIFAWLFFWIWLKFHGVTFADSIRRMVIMFIGSVLEITPGIDIIPAWTATVIIIVLLVWYEDKKKIEEYRKATQGKAN